MLFTIIVVITNLKPRNLLHLTVSFYLKITGQSHRRQSDIAKESLALAILLRGQLLPTESIKFLIY